MKLFFDSYFTSRSLERLQIVIIIARVIYFWGVCRALMPDWEELMADGTGDSSGPAHPGSALHSRAPPAPVSRLGAGAVSRLLCYLLCLLLPPPPHPPYLTLLTVVICPVLDTK